MDIIELCSRYAKIHSQTILYQRRWIEWYIEFVIYLWLVSLVGRVIAL